MKQLIYITPHRQVIIQPTMTHNVQHNLIKLFHFPYHQHLPSRPMLPVSTCHILQFPILSKRGINHTFYSKRLSINCKNSFNEILLYTVKNFEVLINVMIVSYFVTLVFWKWRFNFLKVLSVKNMFLRYWWKTVFGWVLRYLQYHLLVHDWVT